MFSTDAQELMYDRDNRPYPDYKKFYEYYGQYDYAHQWVQSAFDGIPTSFDRGNADFTLYSDAGRTGKFLILCECGCNHSVLLILNVGLVFGQRLSKKEQRT